MDLPTKALSVRQPWAWAIIHAGKDIENRSWQFTKRNRGNGFRVAIHASIGVTAREYADAAAFMRSIGVTCPPAADLERGGIIGSVRIDDCVTASSSPWFFGPLGFVLRDPVACSFVASKGALGFFDWAPGAGHPAAPARWMMPQNEVAPVTTGQMEMLG